MSGSHRPTPSHRPNAYCTVIIRVYPRVGYGWKYCGAGRVRVRVASVGTCRVAEMVNPHTPSHESALLYFWLLHVMMVLSSTEVISRAVNNIFKNLITNFTVVKHLRFSIKKLFIHQLAVLATKDSGCFSCSVLSKLNCWQFVEKQMIHCLLMI